MIKLRFLEHFWRLSGKIFRSFCGIFVARPNLVAFTRHLYHLISPLRSVTIELMKIFYVYFQSFSRPLQLLTQDLCRFLFSSRHECWVQRVEETGCFRKEIRFKSLYF